MTNASCELSETLHWYCTTKQYFALFFIWYIAITCIHIYSSIFDICFNFLHMYAWIFSTHVFYLKFFHNCSLPDVASVVIVLLDIISFVAAFSVDDEPNKIEFVIDTHSWWIHWNTVLIFYDIVYFALFFISYISITCIHIYSSIFDISVNFFTYVHMNIFTHMYST